MVFISKARPGDDEFALWLAPRLEAAGYTVFADILWIDGGTRWRPEITTTLQKRAVKMLLCCSDASLAKEGVLEEIGIASDLAKQLGDTKFIIPLRLEPYKKIFGIGELQWVDFTRGWAEGLEGLLDTLRRQKVPQDRSVQINPNWEVFRLRGALPLKHEPERLTSNWLRIVEIPDVIRYFEATGAIDQQAMKKACRDVRFPTEPHLQGFLSFATESEVNDIFSHVGRFKAEHESKIFDFTENGLKACGILGQEAGNMVHSMFRQAWNRFCLDKGFLQHQYSRDMGFHASSTLAPIGRRFPWGRQGDKRSSMLRNVAKGNVWQFGVSGLPALWPFPHFKLKSRVLFSPMDGDEAGPPFDDYKKQHRLRRTVCKGWRNKQWHGRIMAFIELLSDESSYVTLPLSPSIALRLEAAPILFSSPVSTLLPDEMQDDEEEHDSSTLGRPETEEEP